VRGVFGEGWAVPWSRARWPAEPGHRSAADGLVGGAQAAGGAIKAGKLPKMIAALEKLPGVDPAKLGQLAKAAGEKALPLIDGLVKRDVDDVVKKVAPSTGRLIFNPATRSWTSPGGLVYGQGSAHGNRVKHVLDHLVANPSKATHSVFKCDRTKLIGLLDDAWARKGSPLPNDPGAYVVDMGRVIGTAGETKIKVIVRPGTNELITAYPIP